MSNMNHVHLFSHWPHCPLPLIFDPQSRQSRSYLPLLFSWSVSATSRAQSSEGTLPFYIGNNYSHTQKFWHLSLSLSLSLYCFVCCLLALYWRLDRETTQTEEERKNGCRNEHFCNQMDQLSHHGMLCAVYLSSCLFRFYLIFFLFHFWSWVFLYILKRPFFLCSPFLRLLF